MFETYDLADFISTKPALFYLFQQLKADDLQSHGGQLQEFCLKIRI